MSAIVATATALPPYRERQEDVKRAFCARFRGSPKASRLLGELMDAACVETRHAVVPLDEVARPRALGETRELYRRSAVALAARCARECLDQAGLRANAVDAVITVSCTGVLLPSLGAHLLPELQLREDVVRLPLTELGCAGGAAALARANDLATARPDANVLVVAVELPSLNLQLEDSSPSNMVASAIFGDGAGAALVRGGAATAAGAMRILASSSHLEPGTLTDLRFDLEGNGFHAVLGRELPAVVARSLPAAVDAMMTRAGLSRAALTWYALHAGGKKVLQAAEDALRLQGSDTECSWDVMRRHGNQSSASVLFVLDTIRRQRPPAPGSMGLLAAFGPGVATELVLLSC